jgi:hypothetical protein
MPCRHFHGLYGAIRDGPLGSHESPVGGNEQHVTGMSEARERQTQR